VEKDLSPRIGTFGQTGPLGYLIDRPLPARLSLLQGLPRGIPSLGYLRGDLLLDVMLGHRKLYGLTRTRQRFRCLKIGNRFSRSLTTLAVFAIAGKIGIAIDLVHLRTGFAHALTRFVGDLVQALPVQILGGGPSHLLRRCQCKYSGAGHLTCCGTIVALS
jgi:hypothetical protein